MTSAPKSAMTVVATGPAMKLAASITRMPWSARGSAATGSAFLVALSDEPGRAIREQDVERRQTAVAPCDVALQLELLLAGKRRRAIELLLQHAQAVADAYQLLEEHLDGYVLGLPFLAGHESQRAAHPALG